MCTRSAELNTYCSWQLHRWSHEQPSGNRRLLLSWHGHSVLYVKRNGVHERWTTCLAAVRTQVLTWRLTDCCCISQAFISFPSPFLYKPLLTFNIQILLELSTYVSYVHFRTCHFLLLLWEISWSWLLFHIILALIFPSPLFYETTTSQRLTMKANENKTSGVPFFHFETSLNLKQHELMAIISATVLSLSTLNTCRPLTAWQPCLRRSLIKAVGGEWSRHVLCKSYSPTSKGSLITAHLISLPSFVCLATFHLKPGCCFFPHRRRSGARCSPDARQ